MWQLNLLQAAKSSDAGMERLQTAGLKLGHTPAQPGWLGWCDLLVLSDPGSDLPCMQVLPDEDSPVGGHAGMLSPLPSYLETRAPVLKLAVPLEQEEDMGSSAALPYTSNPNPKAQTLNPEWAVPELGAYRSRGFWTSSEPSALEGPAASESWGRGGADGGVGSGAFRPSAGACTRCQPCQPCCLAYKARALLFNQQVHWVGIHAAARCRVAVAMVWGCAAGLPHLHHGLCI